MFGKRLKKNKSTLFQKIRETSIPLLYCLIIISALFSYALLFPRLYAFMGDRAIALIHLITIGAAALLGLRGGLFFALLASVTIGLLTTQYAGYTLQHSISIGIPATLFMLTIGGGVGFCRDLIVKLKLEVQERKRVEVELKKLKEDAETENRAKSEFLANMSHEIRTPLNHIIGFTELVVDKNCGELNEDQEEYLKDVLTSSRHLLSLINDILDLAKVESGKMELDISDINTLTLLENSLGIIKEKAIKHNIKLSLDVDGIPDIVRADERKFKQIIYNLLSNAMKSTPDGGSITLGALYLSSVHDPLPAILGKGSWSHSDWIEISVKDTGIGINPRDLKGLFDPFTQVKTSTAQVSPHGTGLGLSLAKEMVELHGGRIWGESDGEGNGCTFNFVIPIST